MLVITGPNGNVGTELVKAVMRQKSLSYRIATRDPEKIKREFGSEASCQRFDFADKRTWEGTLEDADTVFLLFPLPHPKTAGTWMVPFVKACVKAQVKHIIYVSVPAADTLRVVPHHAVERAVRDSGIDYTILQASYFSQNMCRDITTHGVDIAVYNEIFIPAKRGKTSFIDSRDLAEVVVNILREPAPHKNKTYLVTGPEALDYYEVADLYTEELGRNIRYANPSLYAFWRRLSRRGVSWDTMFFMLIVYNLTRYGKNAPLGDDLEELLGRPPTTMRQFIRDYQDRWAPNASETDATKIVRTPGLGLR